MAESAVSFVVEKLGMLLENEVRHYLKGVRGGIGEVRDELEAMKAFLQEADAMEDTDEGLKAWVKQVRELAYDAEDVIDDFLIRFEHPKPSGLFGRLSKIARALKTLKARRRISSELHDITSRAISISERRPRDTHNLSSTQFSSGLRDNARLVPEAQLVGIERTKAELLGSVLEDAERSHGIRVMAVQGMGGLGKTTLVNQVYEDDQVKKQFRLRAWVTVSQSFDEREILLTIMKQIGVPIPEEPCSKDIHSLKVDIQSFLQETRYLIVLDDVWTINAWESLKNAFPGNNFGSCLIVATRINKVANKVTTDTFGGSVYALLPLIEDESWNLFCARVFQGKKCPDHLVEDSRLILKRCQGLPLAIVSISSLLASKHSSKQEWLGVRRSLEAELFGNDQLSDMEKILSLSFNDLPYHLKSCVLHLSLFPENFHFHRGFMVGLWIAEGFVKQMGNATLEEVAELYFSELVSRSLIQVVKADDRGEDCSFYGVHSLVREVLLRKSKNQNFATTINEQNLVVPKGVRRLSVVPSLERLQGDNIFSRLRSLIFVAPNVSNNNSSFVSEFLSNRGIRLLKVLDCSRLTLNSFPIFITTQYNLKYLSLSNSKVTSIPRSIGRLRNLESLDLTNTPVEELPDEILHIHGLRHLMAFRKVTEGSPPKMALIGVRVPTGIDTLTSLQSLFLIKVSQCGSDFITSLGKLKQLRDLHIQQLREEHGPVLCSSIEQMSHLRRLHLESTDADEILDVQHISSPPLSLKELGLEGRLTKLPSWISDKLKCLGNLFFENCKLKVDPLESLQALPNLVDLRFTDNAYDGDELCFRAGGFKMLKQLLITTLDRLKRVIIEEGSMPSIELLFLNNCLSLEEMPSGIEFLTDQLKEPSFIQVGDQIVRRIRPKSEDSRFRRKSHVPSLVIDSYDDEGNWVPIFE